MGAALLLRGCMKEYSLEEFQAEFPGMFDNVYCGFNLPRGWGEIVRKGCKDLMACDTHRVHVHQVKEKFGGLRFYFTEERLPPAPKYLANEDGWGNPEDGWEYAVENHARWIEEIVGRMEAASFWVCQDCGTTQNVDTRGGWILTLCEPCRETHYK